MKKILYLLCVIACTVFCFVITNVQAAEQFSFISKPAKGSTNNEAPILKITANVVTGAKRYTIELNTNADFTGTSIIRTSEIDNQRTMIFKNLAYSTTYYARATTDVSSNYGKVTWFTTKAEIFPMVIDPTNLSTGLDPLVIKVETSIVKWATHYTVELSTTNDFTNDVIVLQTSTVKQTAFLFRTLNYSTTYYVHIKSDVNTAFGPVSSFSTRAESPHQRLWGMTWRGGSYDKGSIYSFSVDSAKFTKHLDNNLTYHEVFQDYLIPASGGGFYGVASTSYFDNFNGGRLFYFNPDTLVYLTDSGFRNGSIMLASDNFIYITEDSYGNGADGIAAYNADNGNQISTPHQFGPKPKGNNPEAPLIELPDGYLYGTTVAGGNFNNGVIYKLKPDGSSYQVIYHFNRPVTGGALYAGLTDGHDGFLYGVADVGGTYDNGTIFKLRPDGSDFTILHVFNTDGSNLVSEVIIINAVIYGTAEWGGESDGGVVYKINTDGTGFSVLHNFVSFSSSTGYSPQYSVVADKNNTLYGVTVEGGIHGGGTIYKLKTDGSGFSELYHFSSESGFAPSGRLTLTDDVSGGAANARKLSQPSAIQINNEESFSVSPNPFHDKLNITTNGSSGLITIMDVNGKVVYQSTNAKDGYIKLGNDISSGVYLIKIVQNNKTITRRLIKN